MPLQHLHNGEVEPSLWKLPFRFQLGTFGGQFQAIGANHKP